MEPQEYATLPLTETEVRVLGCLVEKEATTPDHYPLTLNALVAACNQKSNRSPTMSLDDRTVVRALDKLRDKKLALMLTGASNRVPKYAHTLGKAFPVDPAQSAVLCVLMLRGPQTLGEIKSRCERLHRFDTVEATEDVLTSLQTRDGGPLTGKLPRQPGRREHRYMHALAGDPGEHVEETAAPSEPVRAAVEEEEKRLEELERQIAELRTAHEELRREFDGFRAEFR